MSRLLGGILLAAGILIATLSGLCSLVFLYTMVGAPPGQEFGARGFDGLLSSLVLIGIFGGPPIGLGALLIFFGRRVLRRSRAVDPSDVF